MTPEFFIALAIILFLSALLHGSIGFGFPMIATPLLALFTDIQTAIMFTLIPTILVNISSIISEERFINVIKQFTPFALLTMSGSAVGTFILIYANSNAFKFLLALMILIYLFMDKLKIDSTVVQKYPKVSLGFAGVLGGLTNVMAPILIMFALESKYSKSQTIQFSNLCFLFGKLIQLLIFSILGSLSVQEVSFSLGSLVFVGIALYFGFMIKKRIDAKAYNRFIKLLLFCISMMLLYQVVSGEAI